MTIDLDLPPRLRCEGHRLVKPNGEEIVLRGVNLGAWGEDTAQDCPQVAALGGNVVRIPLRWWGRYGDPTVDARDNDAVAFIRRSHIEQWLAMIASAAAAGLWVVAPIDSNCGQSGTQDGAMRAFCDPYRAFGAAGRNFFTDPPMRKLYGAVWQAVAHLLRTQAKVALLELLPEPLDSRDARARAPLASFYRYMVDAVREADPDTPVLIGARDAYNVTLCDEAFLDDRENIVYTGNLLSQYVTNPDKFAAGMDALTAMRERRNVPLFVQQLGRKTGADRNLSHMRAALQAMRDARMGFAWWQWKQNTANPDDYGLNYKTDDGAGWIAKNDEQATLAEFL